MKKTNLTLDELLELYKHYREVSQLKPIRSGGLSTFLSRCHRNYSEPYLTQTMVNDWWEKRDTESENTHYTRTMHVRHFLNYLLSRNIIDITIPPQTSKWTAVSKKPSFMTDEEIENFFRACDEVYNDCFNTEKYLDTITVKTIFRLLYSTGMRPNEARYLSISDVDLETGVISINETKGYNHHMVVLCDSMLQLMQQYNTCISKILPNRKYFFCKNSQNEEYSAAWLCNKFNKYWHKYNSSEMVVYGFRHHYAIANINSWVDLGQEESYEHLLALSKSMGHSKLKHTLYYYSLCPQYGKIMQTLSEGPLREIIQTLPYYEEETE